MSFLWLHRVVVLSDIKLIQEAGNREELIGRNFIEYQALKRGSVDPLNMDKFPGVIWSRGNTWQEQRRFSLQALRDLGFGKNRTEEMVLEEVADLSTYLDSTNAEPINIRSKLNIAILNALWRITTSEKLSYDDPRLKRILVLLDDVSHQFGSPVNSLLFSNKIVLVLAEQIGISALGSLFTELGKYVREIAKPLEAAFQSDSLTNFVEHYLKMAKEQEQSCEMQSFLGKEGQSNMVNVIIDLFIAGSETTSTTLHWAMLYMILNPDIQRKVQDELDEVFGKGHQPTTSDRAKTPYTEAVIHEVQRLGNVAYRAIPHSAEKDCYLSSGHFIPKNTMILCHLESLMKDPEVFPEPDKFDPVRYLDSKGNFKPHPRVVPFGVGRRRCLGENLARMELYLFFTGILAKFNLERAFPNDKITTDSLYGFVKYPKAFNLRFIPRL